MIKYKNYYIDDIDEDIKTIENFNESILLSGLIGGSGLALGSTLTALYKNYRIKLNSCKNIQDPILNDKCQINVIDSMISDLNAQIDGCDKNLNPAECKLKLINKIEELQSRRMLYMRNMYRLKKVKKEQG